MIRNKIKQYGSVNTIKFAGLSLLRTLIEIRTYKVLAILNHHPKSSMGKVSKITLSQIDEWYKKEIINESEMIRFKNFLKNNCIGYYIKEGDEIAGWAFVQQDGKYIYGKSEYVIPNNVEVLKNLFVNPKYRGQSYGKLLNEARINSIPHDKIPIGFVIKENRFALRNLKLFSFEEVLKVTSITFFKKWKKERITKIKSGKTGEELLKGFNLKSY